MKKNTIAILICIALFSVMLCSCGDSGTESSDPTALIIGTWRNEEAGVVTEFKEDGSFTTTQNGEIVLSDAYTVEKVDDTCITLTTGEGVTLEIVFTDENTIQSEDATLTRVPQNELNSDPEKKEDSASSPETLIIGKWVVDNSSIEFDKNGSVYINEDGEESTYTYELNGIDETSVTITLIDADGTTSSETAVFSGDDILMIGDTSFSRAK